MNWKEVLKREIASSQEFFNRSTRALSEEDSNFAPHEGMMTVSQQVQHTADTINWLIEGAFSEKGFDMNFEQHAKELLKTTSLGAARANLAAAFASALKVVQESSEADLDAPVVPNPIMGGEPRVGAFLGIIEHTAHHRGALAGYTRALGRIPPMPYMDTE